MPSLIAMAMLSLALLSHAEEKTYTSEGQKFTWERVVQKSDVIWGFDFLPDGRILYTERSGKMFLFDERRKKEQSVEGVPKVHAQGQGGLLDVRVHPEFAKNRLVYFTYAEPVKEKATTVAARAELLEGKLVNMQKIFTAEVPNGNDIHFGSRLEFDKGHVFISVGDRNERDEAQDLSSHYGKMIRLKEDGSIPPDNPFTKRKGARPEIWSYGHRNPQGLGRHPDTGELWEVEFGPQGGDEVNVIHPGKNYGWPVITYGREYHGPKIGVGTHKEGMEQPVVHWEPAISPSGMSFYNGDLFPAWEGNLFLGNLSGQHIRRLWFKGGKVAGQEELLKELGFRFRHLRQGPQGSLYFSTDEGVIGKILRR